MAAPRLPPGYFTVSPCVFAALGFFCRLRCSISGSCGTDKFRLCLGLLSLGSGLGGMVLKMLPSTVWGNSREAAAPDLFDGTGLFERWSSRCGGELDQAGYRGQELVTGGRLQKTATRPVCRAGMQPGLVPPTALYAGAEVRVAELARVPLLGIAAGGGGPAWSSTCGSASGLDVERSGRYLSLNQPRPAAWGCMASAVPSGRSYDHAVGAARCACPGRTLVRLTAWVSGWASALVAWFLITARGPAMFSLPESCPPGHPHIICIRPSDRHCVSQLRALIHSLRVSISLYSLLRGLFP